MTTRGRGARNKGARIELEIAKALTEAGLKAHKVPLSGAAGGRFADDLLVESRAGELRAEVKARANGEGFAQLERWKGAADLLILKRDRKGPMIVMDLDLFVRLARGDADA